MERSLNFGREIAERLNYPDLSGRNRAKTDRESFYNPEACDLSPSYPVIKFSREYFRVVKCSGEPETISPLQDFINPSNSPDLNKFPPRSLSQ